MIKYPGVILSVPSWVIPGTYAENLRFLKDKKEIQGVELLFFLYDDEIKNMLDCEWDEIRGYRERFVFTAHLPERLLPAHGELVCRLAPLVRHFIVHPSIENPSAQASLLAEWTKQYGASFLAENTNFGLLEALLPYLSANPEIDSCVCKLALRHAPGRFASKVPLCMDTGHLLLDGQNPADFYKRRQESIGEIHLHAVDRKQASIDGRLADHRPLRRDEEWLLDLLPLLENYRGIINLEVFSWEEAVESIEVFR